MAAIITSKFRLDSTNKFVESLSDNQFYMALGRPNAWTDDASPDTPYENDYASNTLWENMFAMKRVDAADIVHCTKRNLWVSGTTYVEYDDQDSNIEGKTYFVISDNNNVYMCLRAGAGASTYNPDTIGVQTSGVIGSVSANDGYIWKYMYTVPATDVTKFLTSSFMPCRKLTEQPAVGADAGLTAQWAVQGNAIDGAIYNLKITTAGVGYTGAPTITISGDGSNAAATCTVSGGAINSVTMTNVGTGYTHATVTLTTSGSSTAATVRPVIGPPGGYGADPTNDLRAHYVTVNTVFTGDESGSIPDSNDFRQIAVVKNPIELATQSATLSAVGSMVVGNFYKILTIGTSSDAHWVTAGSTSGNPVVGEVFKAIATTSSGSGTIAQVAEASAYNTCKSVTIPTGLHATYVADFAFEGHTSGTVGAKGICVEYNTSTGVLHYIQNETTGFGTFTASHFTRATGASTAGDDISAVTAPLVNHHSGDVMFIENRTATTRASGQVETVRLVIAF